MNLNTSPKPCTAVCAMGARCEACVHNHKLVDALVREINRLKHLADSREKLLDQIRDALA